MRSRSSPSSSCCTATPWRSAREPAGSSRASSATRSPASPLIPQLTSGADGGANLNALAFAGFQATFAIITVALISGAIADRAKFGAWMVFAGLWVTLVYFPVASWVFNLGPDGGWIQGVLHVNDFAGGTAVHINAGAAGLALAIVLGRRVGFAKGMVKPHNVPLTLLGASLLWFGWFGFNAGSEAAVDGVAATAWINTLAAPAAATLGWLIVEKIKDGKATSIGAASGAVAGLVAITPACNILTPFWGMVLGLLVGAVCAVSIDLKWRLGFDDSLDVVGIHFVGGWIGTLFIGLFGQRPRPVLRLRSRVARPAGPRGADRHRLLLLHGRAARLDHPEDHGLPDHQRGRGRRSGHHGARRGELRLGRGVRDRQGIAPSLHRQPVPPRWGGLPSSRPGRTAPAAALG